MCKTCKKNKKVFNGKNHVPNGNGRGAGSHKGIVVKDNPGKKLRSHANSKPHKDVIESLTQL